MALPVSACRRRWPSVGTIHSRTTDRYCSSVSGRTVAPTAGSHSSTRNSLTVVLAGCAYEPVAETTKDVRQERLRVAARAKPALRALDALSVLVVPLVIDDGPSGAALVNVSPHDFSSRFRRRYSRCVCIRAQSVEQYRTPEPREPAADGS